MQIKTDTSVVVDELDRLLGEMFGKQSPPREEILRHKWFESERAGRDIGIQTALYDWRNNYYALWKELQETANHVEEHCASRRRLEFLVSWVLLPLAALLLAVSVAQWFGYDYARHLGYPKSMERWLAYH
jgi:hypothetical protein